MKPEKKILIYLVIFALFDIVIPIPITAIVLLYVLFEKPSWFKETVLQIYNNNDSI